ncbi:WD repeat-containing protein, putative [Entamoeba invadens IP1]|uniref:WD repeat-containing protein, putative n=2 Tax=Entamoeba invadens TaxID=33085 RepID=A0A0A1U666_ENTIV|nr:WD repeat-containing protein, putative [Entamoeba invadens IP1]ELP87331.1 WD repeat-containing protein, putative [Entamoeba invadens IP1]BAN42382.1 WD repeat-containing protein, putative [Entamoeba invadens]|eukprot:XP_004254102.1 WD repeat-containing protein, putative [Entamoeba invadens IP1]
MMRNVVFNYVSANPLYSVSWSNRKDKPLRIATTSFMSQIKNSCEVIQLNEQSNQMLKICDTVIEYPPTKVQFSPDTSVGSRDLLVTGGLKPQIFEIQQNRMASVAILGASTEALSPCTSLDWNTVNKDRLATCSLDTTVTVWSVETCQPIKKLIAHDKEVYDVAFAANPDLFGTVGGDGSLRMFDLRSLEHSTILYESQGLVPLLRLAWNRFDANYIATFSADSNKIVVIDARKPAVPYSELALHQSNVNAICWSPHSSTHICSASTDRKALIWDLYPIESGKPPMVLQYEASGAVNDVSWCGTNQDLICVSVANQVQAIRI